MTAVPAAAAAVGVPTAATTVGAAAAAVPAAPAAAIVRDTGVDRVARGATIGEPAAPTRSAVATGEPAIQRSPTTTAAARRSCVGGDDRKRRLVLSVERTGGESDADESREQDRAHESLQPLSRCSSRRNENFLPAGADATK